MFNFDRYRSSTAAASAGVAFAGLIWGLYWIPIRLLHENGLAGAWAGIALYCMGMLFLLPWIWAERENFARNWKVIFSVGLASGSGMALFSMGIALTEVVRATLLFYLSPVWATGLGILFLGEKLTLSRLAAVVFGLVGGAVLLSGGVSLPLPQNLGDWMALLSGITFAFASILLFKLDQYTVTEQVTAFVAGAIVVSLAIVALAYLFGITALATVPQVSDLVSTWPHLVWGGLYVLPLSFLVIWPAKVLSPGRVTLLLMGEILIGAVSAALLIGEVLSLVEIIGGAMIVSAGLVEVFGNQSQPKKPSS